MDDVMLKCVKFRVKMKPNEMIINSAHYIQTRKSSHSQSFSWQDHVV